MSTTATTSPASSVELERTRLSATTTAATAADRSLPLTPDSGLDLAPERDINDARWFEPSLRTDQHYRRPRGPAMNPLTQPAGDAANELAIAPSTVGLRNVDGTERRTRAAHKAEFMQSWREQQLAQFAAVAPVRAAAPAAAHIPKSKVAFHTLPADRATGLGFNFFPNDSPPPPGAIPPVPSAADILSRSVEFLPLSTPAGQSGGGSGIWSRMSTWSKIQWNREGMKLEEERGNARGTAEQVLYTIWQRTQQEQKQQAKQSVTAANAPPVYKQVLPDGTVLRTSNPPVGVGAPVPPPKQSAYMRLRIDRERERNAMAAHDWNVQTAHDPTILNPYDPVQRKKKTELLELQRRGINQTGLFAGLTTRERQARVNAERERMVYEDCNAIGALRPSSYRFIPKVNNRRMYATTYGPAAFGAGAPFAAAPLAATTGALPAVPADPAGMVPGWAGLASTPQEAWKLHHSNLKRERGAMKREDVDARTGVRHAPLESEWRAAKRRHTRQEKEKAAMARCDRNVLSGGQGPRAGIFTAHLGPLAYASKRGATYELVALPPRPTNRARMISANPEENLINRHATSGQQHAEGARYYKRRYTRMTGQMLPGDADQSTNVNDEPNFATAFNTPLLLSHGQAYSQRARLRYRFPELPVGYSGLILPPGATSLMLPPELSASPPAVVIDKRSNKPIKKHRAASSAKFNGTGAASPADELRWSTNINTTYTLIPRYNEPDAMFNPTVNQTAVAAATAAATAASAPAPFVYDDRGLPYIFDRQTPWSQAEYLKFLRGGAESDPTVFGTTKADFLAFPLRAKQKLFAVRPLYQRAAKQAAKRTKTAAAEFAAAQPRTTNKYLSQRYEEEQAEWAAMAAAQRALQPWDASLGAASGAVGFGGGSAAGNVFFSPTSSFVQTPGTFATTVANAFTFAAPATTAAQPLRLSRRTLPALATVPRFPTDGSSVTPAFANNSAPADTPSADPLAALAAAFDASVTFNPFRAPEQLQSVQTYLDHQKASADAQAAAEKARKEARRKERAEKVASVSSKKRSGGAGREESKSLDLEAGFTDTNWRGETITFRASPPIASQATPKSKTSSTTAAGESYTHPVFGDARNPYSQTTAFEKWSKWNAKHAPMVFSLPTSAVSSSQAYSFRPLPFEGDGARRRKPFDTSSEDDSDNERDEEERKYPSFPVTSPSSKRKGADPHPSHGAALSFSQPTFKTAAVAPRVTMSSRSKKKGCSTSNTRSSATRQRSPSPDDPFEYHAQQASRHTTRASNLSVSETFYPPHRSSVPYANGRDSPDALLAAVGLQQHRTAVHGSSHDFDSTVSPSLFNTRVTPSAFEGAMSRRFVPSLSTSTSSSSFVSPPPVSESLGQFHTGYAARTGDAGFMPFSSTLSHEHTSRGSYAAPSTLSASPTKRIKAIRRERGTKRGEWDEDRRTDAEERERQAALERDQWRREQEEATLHQQYQEQSFRRTTGTMTAPVALTQFVDSPKHAERSRSSREASYDARRDRSYREPTVATFAPSAASSASYTTNTFNATTSGGSAPSSAIVPSAAAPMSYHHGGVHVNFHAMPTAAPVPVASVASVAPIVVPTSAPAPVVPPTSATAFTASAPVQSLSAAEPEVEPESPFDDPFESDIIRHFTEEAAARRQPQSERRQSTSSTPTPRSHRSTASSRSITSPPPPLPLPPQRGRTPTPPLTPHAEDESAPPSPPPPPPPAVPKALSVFGLLNDLTTERLIEPKHPRKPRLSSSGSSSARR